MKRSLGIAGLVAFLCSPIIVTGVQRGQRAQAGAGAACDRACLSGIADAYLAALVA